MADMVTEEDLARARKDPAFRQQLLAKNLDNLLSTLNKARKTTDSTKESARQIQEGADLAVQLAERLHHGGPPKD